MIKNKPLSYLVPVCALASVLVIATACDDFDENTPDMPLITSPTYTQLSPIEPPAPKYENVPMLERPETMIWKPGYWSYNGSDFEWNDGEVIARPSPTAIWYPAYWARREYGWAFVPGYWQ